eukprot:103900-Prorocentrum_minimum.AAC.1
MSRLGQKFLGTQAKQQSANYLKHRNFRVAPPMDPLWTPSGPPLDPLLTGRSIVMSMQSSKNPAQAARSGLCLYRRARINGRDASITL